MGITVLELSSVEINSRFYGALVAMPVAIRYWLAEISMRLLTILYIIVGLF